MALLVSAGEHGEAASAVFFVITGQYLGEAS